MLSREIVGSLSFALAVGLSSPSFATDKDIRLSPVTPWQVEWAPESCRASRGFGDKDEPSVLAIERFGPVQRFSLMLNGPELVSLRYSEKATIGFGNGITRERDNLVMGMTANKRLMLLVPVISLVKDPVQGVGFVPEALEAASDQVSVTWRNKSVVYETGALTAVFAEIRKCTEDMFRVWNLDKEVQYSLKRQAEPLESPGSWMRPNDFPKKQLWAGNQSVLSFSLLVGADGTPTKCTIPRSFGDEEFRTVTCELLMKRARFEPAIDAQGNPVASVYLNTVHWFTG